MNCYFSWKFLIINFISNTTHPSIFIKNVHTSLLYKWYMYLYNCKELFVTPLFLTSYLLWVLECKTKWNAIRTQFLWALKQENLPSGSGAINKKRMVSVWCHEFFKNHVGPMRGNVSSSITCSQDSSIPPNIEVVKKEEEVLPFDYS